MRAAMYLDSSRCAGLNAMSAGTRMAPRTSRTSVSACMRMIVAMAPGLAERRQWRAHVPMNSGAEVSNRVVDPLAPLVAGGRPRVVGCARAPRNGVVEHEPECPLRVGRGKE